MIEHAHQVIILVPCDWGLKPGEPVLWQHKSIRDPKCDSQSTNATPNQSDLETTVSSGLRHLDSIRDIVFKREKKQLFWVVQQSMPS